MFTESTSVTSDLTLVAKYNEINYYIVSFESNGGTAIASVEVDEGDTVAAPADPVKASDGNYTYEFEGWYTNVGLTDPFSFSTPITDDLPLYAKYTAQLINSPRSFLNSASPIKTVHGRETPGLSQETTVSKTVLQMVGTPVPSNGTRRENLTVVSDAITLSVNADGNNGKVYSSGTEWRVYQGDNPQVVVAGQNGHLISSISFTFTVGNTGTFKYGNDAFESGDAIDFNNVSSATFTVGNSTGAANGQVKITAISVTYVAPTVTVDNVALRFGLSIPESDWESIRDHDGWTINDYGVMLMKEADLAGYTSIEDAFEKHASSSILKDIHQCQDETPYADPYFDGSDYVFTVKVSFPNDSQYYDDVIYANPYIVVNGTYYFLDDDLYTSVQDLADYYEGSSYEYLSDAALGILAGH